MAISKETAVARLRDADLAELGGRLASGVDTIGIRGGALFVTKRFQSVTEMAEGWRDAQTLVAATIQANMNKLGLDSDLAWDMYLVLICSEPVPDALRLEIEYDKFCCKKYVVTQDATGNDQGLMAQEVPLLCQWTSDGSADALHPGVSRQAILQRLTTGVNSPLADAMTSLGSFEETAAEALVDGLIEQQAHSRIEA
jgi:hypothetical protein